METDIAELVSKYARWINEKFLKTSGADVLSSRKTVRKTSEGVVSTPPSLYMIRGLSRIIADHEYSAHSTDLMIIAKALNKKAWPQHKKRKKKRNLTMHACEWQQNRKVRLV